MNLFRAACAVHAALLFGMLGQHDELELMGSLLDGFNCVPGLPRAAETGGGVSRVHGCTAAGTVPWGRTEQVADWTPSGGSAAPLFDAREAPWPSTPGVGRAAQQTAAVELMTTPQPSAVVSSGTFFTPGVEGGTPGGLPAEEKPLISQHGEMCQAMIDGTAVGSKRRQEVEADVKEAAVCYDWLFLQHSEWLALGTQIRDAAVVRDLRAVRLDSSFPYRLASTLDENSVYFS